MVSSVVRLESGHGEGGVGVGGGWGGVGGRCGGGVLVGVGVDPLPQNDQGSITYVPVDCVHGVDCP